MSPKSQTKKNKSDKGKTEKNKSEKSKIEKTKSTIKHSKQSKQSEQPKKPKLASWEVRIPKKIHSKINKLEKLQREKVKDVIKDLARDPYFDSKRVKKYGKLPVFRRPAGNYRVIYYITKRIRIVDVIELNPRKNVYK